MLADAVIAAFSFGVVLGYFVRCWDEQQKERRRLGIEPWLRRDRKDEEG